MAVPAPSSSRDHERAGDDHAVRPEGRTPGPAHPPGYRDGRLHYDATMAPVLHTDFDVAAYTRGARGRIAVPAQAGGTDARTRADLAYLWRLERVALQEMRAVLMSWTANETRITAFLATWAYERHFLAVALQDLLTALGHPPAPRPARTLRTRIQNRYSEHLLPLISPMIGAGIGEPLTAGHMARMAIHEGALLAASQTLLPRLHGVAAQVVREVARRREDMVDFFRSEARARITRSAAERLAAQIYLLPPWRPLRLVGIADAEETRALASILGTHAGRDALLTSDATIGALLPGNPHPSVDTVAGALRRRRRPTSVSSPGGTHGV